MFLPDIAAKIFPDWNRLVMTAGDALAYCRSKSVWLIEAEDNEVHEGMYTVYRGIEFILLNKNLDPQMKTWVFLHEIYHSAAHYPSTSKFSKSIESKCDAEANMFAAVALMPKPLIEKQSVDEICYYYEIPRALAEIRKVVADNYQI